MRTYGLVAFLLIFSHSLSPAAQEYLSLSSREEIVAKAKAEGKLRALSSMDPDTFNRLKKAFTEKYPFIDTYVEEMTGEDANQRFLLELKAGQGRDWDVLNLSTDAYNEFLPYAKKVDILGMAGKGVLAIPLQMIDPRNRNVVAEGSTVSTMVYNKRLLSRARVPGSWEDFLKPEFKGKKFLVDIRSAELATLAASLGIEWALNYARKIKEQDPIWVRGRAGAVNAMINGEHALFLTSHYHSCIRRGERDPTKSLVCQIIEPVPVRIVEPDAVANNAPHPHAALLWLEFVASPAGQRIIDDHQPLKSSIYAPGSELQKLIKGKKVAMLDWDNFHNAEPWMKRIYEAFGFPQGQRVR
jgi:iron(III) transport system substrate-binding protein